MPPLGTSPNIYIDSICTYTCYVSTARLDEQVVYIVDLVRGVQCEALCTCSRKFETGNYWLLFLYNAYFVDRPQFAFKRNEFSKLLELQVEKNQLMKNLLVTFFKTNPIWKTIKFTELFIL